MYLKCCILTGYDNNPKNMEIEEHVYNKKNPESLADRAFKLSRIILRSISDIFCSFWKSAMNSFDFSSRANRKEYIFFYLAWFFIETTSILLAYFVIDTVRYFAGFVNMVLSIVNISITIRRVRDFNVSGWSYFFLQLVFFIVGIALIVQTRGLKNINNLSFIGIILLYIPGIIHFALMFIKGTTGSNKYGDPPE